MTGRVSAVIYEIYVRRNRLGRHACRQRKRFAQKSLGHKAGADKSAGRNGSEGKREKRTISDIRELKKTGEKMVYMSVPDYTSAQWAEMAGVDVAVSATAWR